MPCLRSCFLTRAHRCCLYTSNSGFEDRSWTWRGFMRRIDFRWTSVIFRRDIQTCWRQGCRPTHQRPTLGHGVRDLRGHKATCKSSRRFSERSRCRYRRCAWCCMICVSLCSVVGGSHEGLRRGLLGGRLVGSSLWSEAPGQFELSQ